MPLPFQSGSPEDPLSRLVAVLLDPPEPGPTLLEPFWFEHAIRTQAWPSTYDHAVLGGLHAPSVGLAFAAGYQAALRRMVPALEPSHLVSLAVTEKAGNHPRAISTELVDGRLSGTKVFATLAAPGRPMLVLARLGEQEGRPVLGLVPLAGDEEGLTVAQGPRPLFVPEITHGHVTFDGVQVAAPLAGDGWSDYVKPFRTLEDVHVSAAVTAWALAWAGRLAWGRELRERLLATIAAGRGLASADARSPAVHVAVAGWMRQVAETLDGASFEAAPVALREAWLRDRALLSVASKSRSARRERAWERVSGA